MFFQGVSKVSALAKAVTSWYAAMSGSGLFVKNPRLNVVNVKNEISPWLYSPSGRKPESKITGPLPNQIELVLSNQIYISKENLPPSLKNRLIRLAAFQNPEFYKAQAMRFPTYDKPRIVHCCEDFFQHIGLPRGCLEDVVDLLESHGVQIEIRDERLEGVRLKVHFRGELRQEQKKAAEAVLAYENGVLSAATAFGKTVVAAYLIAKRSVNTLVLVDLFVIKLMTRSRLKKDHLPTM